MQETNVSPTSFMLKSPLHKEIHVLYYYTCILRYGCTSIFFVIGNQQ